MKTPCLTPDIMADDDALALAVNTLLMGSKKRRKITKKVCRAQDRLHKVVNGKAWKKYMPLEEIVNERTSHETDLIIRWAYEAGRRHGVALGVQLVTCPTGDERRT